MEAPYRIEVFKNQRASSIQKQLKRKVVRDILNEDFTHTDYKRVVQTLEKDAKLVKRKKYKVHADFYDMYLLYEKESDALIGISVIRSYEFLHFDEIRVPGLYKPLSSNPNRCVHFDRSSEFEEEAPLRNREILFVSASYFAPWVSFVFSLLQIYAKQSLSLWLRLDKMKPEQRCPLFRVLNKRFQGFPFFWESEVSPLQVHWQFPEKKTDIKTLFTKWQKEIQKSGLVLDPTKDRFVLNRRPVTF